MKTSGCVPKIHNSYELPSEPLISVTLPNYNYGRFLRQAIESVLHQSYSNVEILFVDDGSTDESRMIAEEFQRLDGRFKPVFFSANQGVMAALQNAWTRVSGDLVYQFSSDDALCDRDFFRSACDALSRHPDAAGFFGVARTISTESGDEIGQMGAAPREGFLAAREFLNDFLAGAAFVPGISSIWRRRMMPNFGFHPGLGPQVDYLINHLLPAKHGVVFRRVVFAIARVSESGTSYSSTTSLEAITARLTKVERFMRTELPIDAAPESAWQNWRSMQMEAILAGRNPIQARITQAKVSIRRVLPPSVFRMVNLLWRQTLGRAVKAIALRLPQYRAIRAKYRTPGHGR